LWVGRVAEVDIDTTAMPFLGRHFAFFVCCSRLVTCNVEYAVPLPTVCHNSVLELSPIHYIASGTNYSNCTLKGQPGTIIHGAVFPECDPYHPVTSFTSGVTTLAGTLVLDGVSLNPWVLHIKGDDISIRNTNISACSSTGQVFVVNGGKVNFDGVQVHTTTSMMSIISLINTTATLTSSSINWGIFEVSNSRVSMLNSSVTALDDETITLRASTLNLSNSMLTLGHGHFSLLDSNATLSNSSIGVIDGSAGMKIGRSTVVADCVPDFGSGRDYHNPPFWTVSPFGHGVSIFSSQLTFYSCSCDISHAIHTSGAPIDIDGGSLHFQGCMSSPSKEVYPMLV
jgi:hypothetical protein